MKSTTELLNKMRMKYWILDENKELVEVECLTWARWFGDTEGRIVKQTECAAGTCFVSTVFIGIDHGIDFGTGHYEPKLFETMIFGGAADLFCDRYPNFKQASLYHDVVVGQVEEIPVWRHALANVRADLRAWYDRLRAELREWRNDNRGIIRA